MKSTKFILVSLLLLPMSLSAEQHSHHNHLPSQLILDQGKKWPIDDSLHKGMNAIKQLTEAQLDKIHHKTLSTEGYAQLAEKLQGQLDYIFKHCKLPEKADAQLHILLAQVMQGVAKMKQDKHQRDGAINVVKALKQYPNYFDDPKWKELNH